MEVQDKGFCYPQYTALKAQTKVPLLLTGAEQELNTVTAFPEVFMDRKHLLSTCPQGQPIKAFIRTKQKGTETQVLIS